MRISTCVLGSLVIGGLALVGCEKAEDGSVKAPAAVNSAVEKAGEAATVAKEKAGEVADAVVAEAQKLFDQAKTYINEKKFDDAAKALTSLEALKSKLPAEWAAKIDELKGMLDKAKAAVGGAATPGQ